MTSGQRRGRWSGVPLQDRQALRRDQLIAAGVTLLVVLLGAGYATMTLDGANKRQQALNAQVTQLQQQMAALAQALGGCVWVPALPLFRYWRRSHFAGNR